MSESGWKLGMFEPERGWTPVELANVFQRETTRGVDRLAIAPRDGHVAILTQLIRAISGPFRFVYSLLDGSEDRPGGYYTVVRDLSGGDVAALLEEFREFFELDGRHTLWIANPRLRATLIFDEHNLLYAYGPLDVWEPVLIEAGLEPGVVEIPFPHSHHRHERLDGELSRLMERETWSFRSPFA